MMVACDGGACVSRWGPFSSLLSPVVGVVDSDHGVGIFGGGVCGVLDAGDTREGDSQQGYDVCRGFPCSRRVREEPADHCFHQRLGGSTSCVEVVGQSACAVRQAGGWVLMVVVVTRPIDRAEGSCRRLPSQDIGEVATGLATRGRGARAEPSDGLVRGKVCHNLTDLR